jgi:cellulose synthase/poly-beta-1,6-N-acetylglucosamine synthase-like glycosyltransferase
MLEIISLIGWVVNLLPTGYWFLLALASTRSRAGHVTFDRSPSTSFVIAIPAHDEAQVIEATVRRLRALNYPAHLLRICIVADHCTDNTAALARQAGAQVYERREGPRSGKGAALTWLFERVLDNRCDAVVIFDADTRVDPDFLRVMDLRLANGTQAIQGRHVISNPDDGWFPALTWAMFLIDNRFQNMGRSNLNWSAKNMGDSICFRAEVLRRIGWGEGLTEDYQLRQRLLLDGIRIVYEPAAIGFGEAPRTWAQARLQRMRWLRGTRDASRQSAWRLLITALRRRDLALLDGALQAYLPSYSTLTLCNAGVLLIQTLINWLSESVFPTVLNGAWAVVVGLLFVYPFFGLALERAPLKAYLVMLSGPLFIIWRTWTALNARFGLSPVTWIRTTHGER